jgi:hypothetical protein
VLAPVKGATMKPNLSFGKKYPCKWHIIMSFVNHYEQMELHVVGSKSNIHWYFFNCDHISTHLKITVGFRVWIFNVKKEIYFHIFILYRKTSSLWSTNIFHHVHHFWHDAKFPFLLYTHSIKHLLIPRLFFSGHGFTNLAKHDYVHTFGDVCPIFVCKATHAFNSYSSNGWYR